MDAYLWTLGAGVPGRAAQRAFAAALDCAWALALAFCAPRLHASIATSAEPLANSAANPGSGR